MVTQVIPSSKPISPAEGTTVTETRSILPPSSARIVSVLLYQGSPRAGASVPRGKSTTRRPPWRRVRTTASAVAASGSETSLHSPAPQTFAELITVASKLASGKDTALGGTSRRSRTAAASSQVVLGIPASNRCLTTIHAPRRLGSRNLTPLHQALTPRASAFHATRHSGRTRPPSRALFL